MRCKRKDRSGFSGEGPVAVEGYEIRFFEHNQPNNLFEPCWVGSMIHGQCSTNHLNTTLQAARRVYHLLTRGYGSLGQGGIHSRAGLRMFPRISGRGCIPIAGAPHFSSFSIESIKTQLSVLSYTYKGMKFASIFLGRSPLPGKGHGEDNDDQWSTASDKL